MEHSSDQFAALSCRTKNLGDDIQALAASQFLPADTNRLVDRDRIGDARVPPGTKMILNGWWMHSPALWPPPPEIDPLIVSFYAVPEKFVGTGRLDYLKQYSRHRPIGARDPSTLALLQDAGIDAYLSGCLTLTLAIADPPARSDRTIVVDLAREYAGAAPADAERATHAIGYSRFWLSPSRRLVRARAMLRGYASARCVITSRLHVALPCLALDTPVLFVRPDNMDGRLAGWVQHLQSCSQAEYEAGAGLSFASNPGPNPGTWKPMAVDLSDKCSAFTGIGPSSLR